MVMQDQGIVYWQNFPVWKSELRAYVCHYFLLTFSSNAYITYHDKTSLGQSLHMDSGCYSFGVGFILWQKFWGKIKRLKDSRLLLALIQCQGRYKVWHHHKNQFTFGSSTGFSYLQFLARIRAYRGRKQDGLVYVAH